MGWDANSLSARMLNLLHQFVPDLYSVTLFLHTSSNTASQGSDVLIRFYRDFTKMSRNSVCPRQVSNL